MAEIDRFDKPIIEPIYSQASPSDPIDLGTVRVEFTLEDTSHQSDASVTIQFVPKDRLLFVIPIKDIPPTSSIHYFCKNNWSNKLKLIDKNVTLDVFCAKIDIDNGMITCKHNNSWFSISKPSDDISYAIFHLLNFPDFLCSENYLLTSGESPRQSYKRCGRITLKADGWKITIAATDKTNDITKKLKEQGGYIITHMGKIEREDGSAFSSHKLDDLLLCLRYYLSFVLGRWAGVALPIGFDADGNRIYEQWGIPMASANSWSGSISWFSDRHGDLLSRVFPGFISLWKKEIWCDALSKALYWYLVAGDNSAVIHTDANLILAQTALECLAWTHCVEDRKMVSKSAFSRKGLSAADRLRLLASSLGIPTAIPERMSTLNARRGKKWEDIPDAITSIRNALVHPNSKDSYKENPCFEAWELSMWMLDLVLLRLCGHEGNYANRLDQGKWAGDVEPVPWKCEPTKNNRIID